MRNILVLVLLAASALMLMCTSSTAQVACIGDSTTYCNKAVGQNTRFDCYVSDQSAANQMCGKFRKRTQCQQISD